MAQQKDNRALLMDYIKHRVETEIDIEFDKYIESLKEKKKEICGKCIVDISLSKDFSSFIDNLKITIN